MVGNPGRPPYVIPRGSAGLKKIIRNNLSNTLITPLYAPMIEVYMFSSMDMVGGLIIVFTLHVPCVANVMILIKLQREQTCRWREQKQPRATKEKHSEEKVKTL